MRWFDGGIVPGVGLFLGCSRPPLGLYSTLQVRLIAYLTVELPAFDRQLQPAFRPSNQT